MEIIIAKYAGFCSGVKKAVQIALSCESPTGSTYTLGPLIHNEHVVKELREKGIKPIDDLDEVRGETVIIRSHGVAPEIFLKAEKLNINTVDATCPFVKKAQNIVWELSKENNDIVIVGDHHHPEVEALVGWSGQKAYVVDSPEEAGDLSLKSEVAVVAQTTQTQENLDNVLELLKSKDLNVKVFNTICNATHQRQNSALSLAREVDVMVVIGGHNSANTRKLAQICSQECSTYHIGHSGELQSEWFTDAEKVGVTAGASTPDRIIEEVVEKMVELNQEKEKNEAQIEEVEQSAQASSEEANDVDTPAEQDDTELVQEQHDALKTFKKGDVIKGHIVQVNENEVMVDVGGKSEGIIPLTELAISRVEDPSTVVQPGDEINVQVIKVEDEEGHPILSKRRVDRRQAWKKLEEAFEKGTEIQGTGLEVVKGGLLVNVGLRGFVPASLVDIGYVENLEEFVGQELLFKVIELDKSKNKIVLSRKIVLENELEKKRQETWEELKEGQEKQGIVRRITDFGAFVDIGAVDGLLHVSEISWGRVDHPSDILSEGDVINVKVITIDREKERVSLGLKQLAENPWNRAEEKYPVSSIVNGKVLRTTPFGAFIEIEPGVEGLAHISQLANEHVEKTEDVISIGDEIAVKVLSVDSKAQRMSLSLKEAKPQEEAPKKEQNTQQPTVEKEDNMLPESGVKLGDIYGDLLRQKANETK